MIFSLAGLALTGGISMLSFTKCFGTIFLGIPRTQFPRPPREVSMTMRLPQYLIILIMLSIGLFPQFYFSVARDVVATSIPAIPLVNTALPDSLLHSLSAIGLFSIVFIILAILIYMIREYYSRRRVASTHSTWGCGYGTPTPRMQYTGRAFSRSLGKLLNFIVLERKKYKEISAKEIFPAERKYSSHFSDFFVTRIFNSIVDRLLFSLNYFQFIQNGKIQLYILYGIFFIVLVFLGTIFKFI
jgi:hypothetical protein